MTADNYRNHRRMANLGSSADTSNVVGANKRAGSTGSAPRGAGGQDQGHGMLHVDLCRMGPSSADKNQANGEATPIWLAALIASSCHASVNGEGHAVRWNCISGRAFYTNDSSEAELIQPLGVCLKGGHTLAVTWAPGETEYTFEVFGGLEHCA